MHLATVIELASQRYPRAEAIIDGCRRFTYEEWNQRINSVAWGLRRLGLKPGERIAICARNSEPAITAYFAAHKAGLTAVLLSTRWKNTEIAHALNDAEIRLIFHDETTSAQVINALPSSRHNAAAVPLDMEVFHTAGKTTFGHLTAYPRGYPPEITRDDGSVGTILYTSGTLGRPKGVQRTHRSDYYAALALIIQHRWTPFERTLGVMPFFHTMGLHCLLSMVVLNGLAVVLPNFDAALCRDCIEKERLTALYLVPTVYYDLTAQSDFDTKRLSSIKKLAFAGAPMSQPLVEQCFRTINPEVFVNQYGSTEMHAITINPDLRSKPASCGRPALHSHIRIVAAEASRKDLPCEEVPPGEVGEIIVQADSPQAFCGYLNRPDANERSIREGWYFTGDLGCLDEEGDLFFKGRLDDMIISGGENVYPQEVEAVLLSHPQVSDAAVVGLPDERWGEKITAVIVPASLDLDDAALDEFCLASSGLPRFMRPRQYIYVNEIPKSPTGKILRSRIRSLLLPQLNG